MGKSAVVKTQQRQHTADGWNNSDVMSSEVREQLQKALQLAKSQQKELLQLRQIIQQQSVYIENLCQRDSALGLELRRHAADDEGHDLEGSMPVTDDEPGQLLPLVQSDSRLGGVALQPTHLVPTDSRLYDGATGILQPTSKKDSAVDTQFRPDVLRQRHTQFDTASSTVNRRLASAGVSRLPAVISTSADMMTITNPTVSTSSPAAIIRDLEDLPVGFEMTTACPICHLPIPFDALSSEAFDRHVDECISRATRDGPSTRQNAALPILTDQTLRVCPVCNSAFSLERYSQADFEKHVDDHFALNDVINQFVPL
jgi:hypothetical protein